MDGTFSIVGRDPEQEAIGVAVATGAVAVGMRVPHAALRVGAVATQARTDTTYGTQGLEMLRRGISPRAVLDGLLQRDEGREHRQVAIMDWAGATALHTGREVPAAHAQRAGPDCAAAGNTLASPRVVDEMISCFADLAHEDLAQRLLAALRAGQAAGGDSRGAISAALLVVGRAEEEERLGALVDLRIDHHPDPLAALARLLRRFREWKQAFLQQGTATP